MSSTERRVRRLRAHLTAGGAQSVIGIYGLGVMGQNLALNIAEKGFRVSVCNRSASRVDTCVSRAKKEGLDSMLTGFKEPADFVASLEKPRRVLFLVQAGPAVDETIGKFAALMEKDDIMIDGGNEWFLNSIRRAEALAPRGIQYVAMGVSGGEEGARRGPSLMPGGPKAAYAALEPLLLKVAAQTDSGACVTYLGPIGSGNYVKMVHNGIEYGDMQLIAESYDILKAAGLTNDELAAVFDEWNRGELESFLVEITAVILAKRESDGDVMDWSDSSMLPKAPGYVVDNILDATGNKGTGKMTVKEGAAQGVACPTIASALDARFLAFGKDARVAAAPILQGREPKIELPILGIRDRAQLIADVRSALYASKICSYAQGMNLIRAASDEYKWSVDLGESARIWKGGCIIRAQFLDRIKKAYERDPNLASLLVDADFARELLERQPAWRRVVGACVSLGIPCPAFAASLGFFDQYRRVNLPANLVQAQRDFFGSHTFERKDKARGDKFHCIWTDAHVPETGH